VSSDRRARPSGVPSDPGYTRFVTLRALTPEDRLVDQHGRPYFLWDEELTLAAFRERLRDPDAQVRAYYLGKLMRQAKPDDVFRFVSLAEIAARFADVIPYLGKTRDFWTWLLAQWGVVPDEPR